MKFKYHNNQLTSTDTNLALAYGLPKIHKKDLPLRPIISLINSPTHFLAKVVYDEVNLAVDLPASYINNSFELKQLVENILIDDDHILISLDVSSLFTNVSLDLVKLSLEKRFHKIHQKCRIPFTELMNSVEFLYKNTYFSYDNKFYK